MPPVDPTVGATDLFQREFDEWPSGALIQFRVELLRALQRARAARNRRARDAALRLLAQVEHELSGRTL